MSSQPFTIQPCASSRDLEEARTLIAAYTSTLNLDLSFQNLNTELSTLPGAYSPHVRGTLLLARSSPNSSPIGIIALRALPPASSNCCELKRLFVVPSARGTGLGRTLVEHAMEAAIGFGYAEMKLDTLREMEGARALYRDMGFEECERYYETPVEGTVFLRCSLVKDGEEDVYREMKEE